jgi:hypothetical protein
MAAGTRKPAAERVITLGIARASHLAAAARDAKMAPALRELAHLSGEMTARELERRGFGAMSHMTVRRARDRLGIPRRRQAERKAHGELVTE